jgi:hypothetical protein
MKVIRSSETLVITRKHNVLEPRRLHSTIFNLRAYFNLAKKFQVYGERGVCKAAFLNLFTLEGPLK